MYLFQEVDKGYLCEYAFPGLSGRRGDGSANSAPRRKKTAFRSLMIYLPGPIRFEFHDVNCIVYSFSILVKLYIS